MELLALLCALGVCSSLTLGSDVKAFAPEDLDGSGDDEDYSGSGREDFDVNILSTSASLLTPTVTQMSTALQPDVAAEGEGKVENTTKPHNIFDDLFAVKDPSSEEGSTLKPSTQQPDIVDTTLKPSQQSFDKESSYGDEKKHHHHHHHHHHTTTPVTTTPEDRFAVDPLVEEPHAEDPTIKPTSHPDSTSGPVDNLEKKHHHHPHHHTTNPSVLDIENVTDPTEVENPFVLPEEPTKQTAEESEVDEKVAPTTKDLVHHDQHQEAASGSSSTTYVDKEMTTLQPNADDFAILVDSEEKTTVADEIPTQNGGRHHHSNHTTLLPFNGSDIIKENANDELDHYGKTTQGHAEDRHHHHHHHPHHHTTTPIATSTAADNLIVDTHESKGRRLHVPVAETTAAVPLNEEEHFSESMEPVDSSEGPSGDADPNDFFIESTIKAVQVNERVETIPEDGSSGASHGGIMDRKELLAGIIAGGLAGLAFAAALVAFVFYRMKKKDEGSYSLEEPKQSNGGYQKPREQREFYA